MSISLVPICYWTNLRELPKVIQVMPSSKTECDIATVVLAFLVFGLPLTLLIPDFSILDLVPKIEVTRCFVFRQKVSWSQLNAVIIALLLLFFCLCLEIKKRKLDEMVMNVLKIRKETNAIMEVERERQFAAIKACVNVLDASGEHYENLTLLKDDLRKRENTINRPPTIGSSSLLY